ncbi:serine/threonine-protein kinase [Nonomuraea soli]|uniref:WD40 repeat protein n=1 Tax=Nonomuraea soli TaxID=1032476 RepID=A0A7W0HNG0_9ACTN|nr:serine/threonine-protein kinase [Nonomuraea soli]MBA2889718.1 WD40 repeat protein [Nonomuraea soli]
MAASPLAEGDPQRIGGYVLAGRLGAGGQGVVFEGYGPDRARVAIKVLHADVAMLRPMNGEVAALLRVAPFCTARIIEFDLDAARPYLVSEFVPGPSLRAVVQEHGPLRGEELYRLAVGTATAMVAVHNAGVVHRDLKPDNVLLGPGGPRVIDFGIARLLTGPVSSGAHGPVGTPVYMAPEVLRGSAAGQAADVYGWAAVILYAATARLPYRAHAPYAELPEPVRSLVLSGLAEHPQDRPDSRDLLLRLLDHRPDPARLMEAGRAAAGVIGPRDSAEDPPLGERAERVFRALPPAEQAAAAGVLLRLLGPDDRLRTAPTDELGDDPAVRAVVEAFARAGILTTSGDGVAIAAPALPVAWPRLTGWLDEERPGQADHHRLREAARMWAANGRRDADLDQGSALERDNRWAAGARRNLRLNPLERDFLAASSALAGRRVRRRRLLLITLALLLSLTAVLATLAESQRRVVVAQRDEAIARGLAARVPSLRTLAPSTAQLLSVAAWRISPVAEARTSVLSSLAQPQVALGIKGAYLAVADHGRVLSWDSDRAEIWDPGSRTRVATIGSPGCCTNAFLSPGASTLLTIDASQTVTRVYDVRSGRLLGEDSAPGNSAAFSADGRRAATFTYASGRPVTVFDLTRGNRVADVTRKNVMAVALSPDASTLAIAVEGRRVELVDLASGRTTRAFTVPETAEEVEQASEQEVRRLRFTADGTTLVSNNGELRFWDPSSGAERVDHVGAGHITHQFALDASGRWLATADGQSVRLWDLRTGRSTTVMSPLPQAADEMAFAQEARSLVILPRTGEPLAVDLVPYTAPPRLHGMGGEATGAALSTRSGRIAMTAPDGIRVWDLHSRRQIGPTTVYTSPSSSSSEPKSTSACTGGDDPFREVDLSPDGTLLAAITPDDAVRVSEVGTGREVARLVDRPARRPGDTWGQQAVAFSPDGRTLVASGAHRVPPGCHRAELVTQTWTAASGWRRAHTTPGVRGPFAFTPDGTELVALDNDGLVLIDPATGRLRWRTDTSHLVIGLTGLTPDARSALVPADALHQVELGTGRLLESPLTGADGVDSTAPAPDGRTLATADRGNRIRLLDAPTGAVSDLAFPGWDDSVLALGFSPDGRTLHAVTSTGIVYSHITDAERAVELLCARVGRQLTRGEWEQHLPGVPYRDVC